MIKVLEFWLDIEVRSRNIFTQRLIHLWRWQRTHTHTHWFMNTFMTRTHAIQMFHILHSRAHPLTQTNGLSCNGTNDATEMCEKVRVRLVVNTDPIQWRAHTSLQSWYWTPIFFFVLRTVFHFSISLCCSWWFFFKVLSASTDWKSIPLRYDPCSAQCDKWFDSIYRCVVILLTRKRCLFCRFCNER